MRSPFLSVLLSILLSVFCCATASALEIDDAELLALELSGQLLPPGEMLAQIASDLASIRACYPYFADIHVFPDWAAGELLVGLTDEAWAQFLNGDYHGLDALNAEYGPVEISNFSDAFSWFKLSFADPYHPIPLSTLYENAEGVRYAEPNGILGDGNDITTPQLSIYHFRRAWGDCPAGCMQEHIWIFRVVDGVVHLLEHYGDFVEEVTGVPERSEMSEPCTIFPNYPNPFNPQATIPYFLGRAGNAEMRIVDARGRVVQTLVNGFKTAGTHVIRWDGTDTRGLRVASGTYFASLRLDKSQWKMRPMTLLK